MWKPGGKFSRRTLSCLAFCCRNFAACAIMVILRIFCLSLVFVCVFVCLTYFPILHSDDVFLPREDIEVGFSSHHVAFKNDKR